MHSSLKLLPNIFDLLSDGLLIARYCTAGVYVPAQQYEEECEERRQLSARVGDLEAEVEASTAQHEAAQAEWEREAAAQRAQHEAQLGQVRAGSGLVKRS
jgi:outer membrane murein-binding lipoprotein Lpp